MKNRARSAFPWLGNSARPLVRSEREWGVEIADGCIRRLPCTLPRCNWGQLLVPGKIAGSLRCFILFALLSRLHSHPRGATWYDCLITPKPLIMATLALMGGCWSWPVFLGLSTRSFPLMNRSASLCGAKDNPPATRFRSLSAYISACNVCVSVKTFLKLQYRESRMKFIWNKMQLLAQWQASIRPEFMAFCLFSGCNILLKHIFISFLTYIFSSDSPSDFVV